MPAEVGVSSGERESRQRLFVAVPLPQNLVAHVQQAQAFLPHAPAVRLLGPKQMHVTLAFIGEVNAEQAQAAAEVVRSAAHLSAGEAMLESFLMLPTARRPRVVALEIGDTSEVFATLFGEVMGGLEAARVMKREKRPFRPHLTIARVKNVGPIQPKADTAVRPFRVDCVRLYESRLRRSGAEYAVVVETRLVGAERG